MQLTGRLDEHPSFDFLFRMLQETSPVSLRWAPLAEGRSGRPGRQINSRRPAFVFATRREVALRSGRHSRGTSFVLLWPAEAIKQTLILFKFQLNSLVVVVVVVEVGVLFGPTWWPRGGRRRRRGRRRVCSFALWSNNTVDGQTH